MKRDKYRILFKQVMKDNFKNKVTKGKGKKPVVTVGAFGKCKYLKKEKE